MILESVITCPQCATAKLETMPTDACQFSYECTTGAWYTLTSMRCTEDTA
jgi:hypothetical protein